jgi:hypothetical protein
MFDNPIVSFFDNGNGTIKRVKDIRETPFTYTLGRDGDLVVSLYRGCRQIWTIPQRCNLKSKTLRSVPLKFVSGDSYTGCDTSVLFPTQVKSMVENRSNRKLINRLKGTCKILEPFRIGDKKSSSLVLEVNKEGTLALTDRKKNVLYDFGYEMLSPEVVRLHSKANPKCVFDFTWTNPSNDLSQSMTLRSSEPLALPTSANKWRFPRKLRSTSTLKRMCQDYFLPQVVIKCT